MNPKNETTVTRDSPTSNADGIRSTWRAIGQTLTRPYRVTIPMVLLVSLVPFYLVIADRARAGAAHAPALAFDRLLPLTPAWALVYGALYGFLIVLPVFVIQQEELIRRAVWAYLTVWTMAYISFLWYPTVAPRPNTVLGGGTGFRGMLSDATHSSNRRRTVRGLWTSHPSAEPRASPQFSGDPELIRPRRCNTAVD